MVESESLAYTFLQLEKKCIGFENYIDADEEHYIKALDGLKALVKDI
jgi:hypothetical protein